MNKAELKALAAHTIRGGAVDGTVRDFVLARLTRPELRQYLAFLKSELARGRVVVRTAAEPDAETIAAFTKRFPGKEMRFVADATIGAGFTFEHGDDIVHFNVRNIIERTIQRAKEKL